MAWGSPKVIAELGGGVALLVIFAIIESHVAEPMLHLRLFRIRAFTAGNFREPADVACARRPAVHPDHLAAGRPGCPKPRLQLLRHAAVVGSTCSPPSAACCSPRPISGSSRIATARARSRPPGALLSGRVVLPAGAASGRLPYLTFAALRALNGIGMGMFISPNRAAVHEQPAGVAARRWRGHAQHLQNSAQVLSIGIFFSLMIIGLAAHLPATLYHGFVSHGVPAATAARISHLPPVTTLFATFLGYNPVKHLLGAHVLASLSAAQASALTGPQLLPAT